MDRIHRTRDVGKTLGSNVVNKKLRLFGLENSIDDNVVVYRCIDARSNRLPNESSSPQSYPVRPGVLFNHVEFSDVVQPHRVTSELKRVATQSALEKKGQKELNGRL